MAIKLSEIAARGGGGGGSVSWDFHAVNRDADGMLTYTKTTSSDTDVVDLMSEPTLDANGDMIFRTMDDYTVEEYGTNAGVAITKHANDTYYQHKWDSRSLSYFIDDEGYLVARMGSAYDYNTNGPK
tara:strand:- start:12158 stop:12538 length:381 start_codon:yes stop_codon:yes gene_type:complete